MYCSGIRVLPVRRPDAGRHGAVHMAGSQVHVRGGWQGGRRRPEPDDRPGQRQDGKVVRVAAQDEPVLSSASVHQSGPCLPSAKSDEPGAC